MRGLIGVLTAVALLAGASGAEAAVTFGPDLTVGDAGQGVDCSTYTYGSGAAPSTCVAMLVAGDAPAPVKGVITSMSIRMAIAVTGHFRVGRSADNTQPLNSAMTMLETSPDVSVPGDSAVHTFAVRLPVEKGDVIGFASKVAIYRDHQTRNFSRWVGRDSPDGSTAEMPVLGASEVANYEVPINATIEGDADGDGYGDETQDLCPTMASTHDACPGTVPVTQPAPDVTPTQPPPPDTFPPVLSPVTIKEKTAHFLVSEAGTAHISIIRLVSGKRCVAPAPRRSRGKPCTKQLKAGQMDAPVLPGSNAVPLKSLKRGRYRVVVQTTDAAGNNSNAVTALLTQK